MASSTLRLVCASSEDESDDTSDFLYEEISEAKAAAGDGRVGLVLAGPHSVSAALFERVSGRLEERLTGLLAGPELQDPDTLAMLGVHLALKTGCTELEVHAGATWPVQWASQRASGKPNGIEAASRYWHRLLLLFDGFGTQRFASTAGELKLAVAHSRSSVFKAAVEDALRDWILLDDFLGRRFRLGDTRALPKLLSDDLLEDVCQSESGALATKLREILARTAPEIRSCVQPIADLMERPVKLAKAWQRVGGRANLAGIYFWYAVAALRVAAQLRDTGHQYLCIAMLVRSIELFCCAAFAADPQARFELGHRVVIDGRTFTGAGALWRYASKQFNVGASQVAVIDAVIKCRNKCFGGHGMSGISLTVASEAVENVTAFMRDFPGLADPARKEWIRSLELTRSNPLKDALPFFVRTIEERLLPWRFLST